MVRKLISPELAKLKVLKDDDEGTSGGGFIEGYASVFGNTDQGRDIVEKGAFRKTLKERMPKGEVLLFDSHRIYDGTSAVIGKVVEAKEDDHGLWFKAQFSAVQLAQDIRTKVQEGILDALSFGFDVVKYSIDENEKVRRLQELKLFEISVVPWGMNPKALIATVKGLNTEDETPWFETDQYKSLFEAPDPALRGSPAGPTPEEPTEAELKLIQSFKSAANDMEFSKMLAEFKELAP
jgi:hypothetical protein